MDDVAKAEEATLAAANAGAKFIYTGMNNGLVGQEAAADEAGIQLINNTTNKCKDPKTGVIYFGAGQLVGQLCHRADRRAHCRRYLRGWIGPEQPGIP